MSKNEALICTEENCNELQTGDCEFCEKHSPNFEEQVIVIYQHNIKFSWHDGVKRELSDCDIEYLKEKIEQGYIEGELIQDEVRGWWSIGR